MAKGDNPNSRANLQKGPPMPKLMYTDSPSQKLANSVLDEEVDYEGEKMTRREAIIREQAKAAEKGDLRAAQFLIELAGRNEQATNDLKTATLTPLEALQAKMLQRNVDDRRKKAD